MPYSWRRVGDRTFEMFSEWFEIRMSSIVEDLNWGEPLGYID